MTKISNYLVDENGKPSSTRLFSWWMLWFFFILNGIYLGLTMSKYNAVLDINFIVYDFMLLLAIFAPKYLSKMQEINNLIDKK